MRCTEVRDRLLSNIGVTWRELGDLCRSAIYTMSINCTYRQISKSDWKRLEMNTDAAMDYLHSIPGLQLSDLGKRFDDPEQQAIHKKWIQDVLSNPQPDLRRVDLNGYWHALHYLITDDPDMTPERQRHSPLHNLVLGGTLTSVECTYGCVRYFENEDLAQLAEITEEFPLERIRPKFDAIAFTEKEIYPNPRPGGWDEFQIAGLWDIYPRLQALIQNTIASREILLVYLR